MLLRTSTALASISSVLRLMPPTTVGASPTLWLTPSATGPGARFTISFTSPILAVVVSISVWTNVISSSRVSMTVVVSAIAVVLTEIPAIAFAFAVIRPSSVVVAWKSWFPFTASLDPAATRPSATPVTRRSPTLNSPPVASVPSVNATPPTEPPVKAACVSTAVNVALDPAPMATPLSTLELAPAPITTLSLPVALGPVVALPPATKLPVPSTVPL